MIDHSLCLPSLKLSKKIYFLGPDWNCLLQLDLEISLWIRSLGSELGAYGVYRDRG